MASPGQSSWDEDAHALFTRTCHLYFSQKEWSDDQKDKVLKFTKKKLTKQGVRSRSDLEALSVAKWQEAASDLHGPNLHACMASLLAEELAQPAFASTAADEPSAAASVVPAAVPSPASDPAPAPSHLAMRTPKDQFGHVVDGDQQITLMVNNFAMKVVADAPRSIWKMWQLEFSPLAAKGPHHAKSSGFAFAGGNSSNPDSASRPREPGQELRKKAVSAILQKWDPRDWLYDERYRLYTISTCRDELPVGEHDASVVGSRGGKLSIKFKVTPAMDQSKQPPSQQQLDLRQISRAGHAENASEELRFVAVALRCHARQNEKLAVIGRRIVCPGYPLTDYAEKDLLNCRELWLGFLANPIFIASQGGKSVKTMCALSLNLVASVGIPQMSAINFLAKFLTKGVHRNYDWYNKQLLQNEWPRELNKQMLGALNSEAGLRKLRVKTDYFGHERKSTIVGISAKTAKTQRFDFQGSWITVYDYFWHERSIDLKQPDLPLLELGKPNNYVPIELVTILGGEHNILAGKLRPEYQARVVREASMPPSARRDAIEKLMNDVQLGPREALREKGIEAQLTMTEVNGRILKAPAIIDGSHSNILPNNYGSSVKAIAPPEYDVHWGLWYATEDQTQDMEELAREFEWIGKQRGIDRLQTHSFVERPQQYWQAYGSGRSGEEIAIRNDLRQLAATHPLLKLLVVVLPSDNDDYSKQTHDLVKMIAETEFGGVFATQCLKRGRDMQKTKQKLHTLMLKVLGKLPQRIAQGKCHGSSHYINLREPHALLAPGKVMVIGADVTHNVAGVSVAGVVATQDRSYVTYFSEVRGQTPFVLEGAKTRRRKAEERILDLSSMVSSLLRKWKKLNGDLPEVVLYYRDGVSNGQFFDVLGRERCQLADAFERIGGEGYNPKLAIIVGQKRHNTRLFRKVNDNGKGQGGKDQQAGKGKGKDNGKGKKGGKASADPAQVPPGTVAGDGIATPGHINFYLVAHEGMLGTSVPCHYHVLHLDERLVDENRIGVNDIERITYDLCHLYPRAGKTVSYASPTYLADHLCERGRLYLETRFPDNQDAASLAASSSSLTAEQEERLREMIQTRVKWLNDKQGELRDKGDDFMEGTNYFC